MLQLPTEYHISILRMVHIHKEYFLEMSIVLRLLLDMEYFLGMLMVLRLHLEELRHGEVHI